MQRKLIFAIIALLSILPTSLFAQSGELTTFTTDDGTFSFDYPSDWFVEVINEDQPNAHLSVNNLPLDLRFESTDGVSLQISLPDRSFLVGGSTVTTPQEAIAQVIPGAAAPIDFATPSANGTPQALNLQSTAPEIKEFMVNNRPAAYGYYEMKVMGMDASQLIIIADLGSDYWAPIMASSFKGGLPTLKRYESAILEIVASMRFTPSVAVESGNPDLPQVYSGLDGIWGYGNLEFYYPADWYAYYSITPVLTNQPNDMLNLTPKSGQFIAAIQGAAETRASIDPSALYDQCGGANSDLTARTLVKELLDHITAAQLEQLNDAGITITQPEVRTVNGKEIVYFRQYQGNIEVLSLFIDTGNGNIPSMNVTANRGEMAQFEEQLFAVAGTFQFTPKPCATPTPTS